ncbi:unnamed protein product [Rotaria sp. Silwood2]|nr:unnamed protein product [Rotaria sp. Silwood2]
MLYLHDEMMFYHQLMEHEMKLLGQAWWSPILAPSSLITRLSINVQLQSYCDLICHHDDTCTYVHNLFGLALVLLIEQFLSLPYISVLRLADLIVYDRIEMMLTLDQQTLNKQLLPKYLPLIL